jgi:hypothetical protein
MGSELPDVRFSLASSALVVNVQQMVPAIEFDRGCSSRPGTIRLRRHNWILAELIPETSYSSALPKG